MGLQFGRCRLPEHLRRSGLSQIDLAIKMGLYPSMITKYVTGEKKMSLLRAAEAAKILGCKIDDLYYWD
jgi:transcriptional regulator with XRE-family HTH domain